MTSFSFVTPTASADGYGCAGESLALAAVREHGADVQVIGYDWADERYSDPEFLALKRHESEISNHDVCVVFFLPYALQRFRSRVTLCQTMWETDKIPPVWAHLIDNEVFGADGVIVPSEHCKEVFEESVSKPVRYVPFGTDTDFFEVVERQPAEGFVFLMSGLLHYRKGLEFALRALHEEFEDGEPVQLWLKTRRDFLDPGSEAMTLYSDERVKVINKDFTREEMRHLYANADCLLAPSRGEGSGLTPRDAMSTGLPVILTNWGGLAEIADVRYNYPVAVECLEPAPTENSSYGHGVTGGAIDIGNFARPSVEHLRARMREVYEDWEDAQMCGREAAEWMRREWSWERCSFKWLAAIEELSAAVLT